MVRSWHDIEVHKKRDSSIIASFCMCLFVNRSTTNSIASFCMCLFVNRSTTNSIASFCMCLFVNRSTMNSMSLTVSSPHVKAPMAALCRRSWWRQKHSPHSRRLLLSSRRRSRHSWAQPTWWFGTTIMIRGGSDTRWTRSRESGPRFSSLLEITEPRWIFPRDTLNCKMRWVWAKSVKCIHVRCRTKTQKAK